jgi:hypothetical protein
MLIAHRVAKKVIAGVYNGVTTVELDVSCSVAYTDFRSLTFLRISPQRLLHA